MNNGYKYFFFSLAQLEERTETYDKMNKTYIPGTVVYNGATYDYTYMSDTKSLPRYPDARLVAEGKLSDLVITKPKGIQKGMTS